MTDQKEKIQRLTSCFCKLMWERYLEKLMKQYIMENGYPEFGEAPKYDQQELSKFEDNLPLFESELNKYIANKLACDGEVVINTSENNLELEQLSLYVFDKCLEDIVGDYKIILDCNKDNGDVTLICKGALVEKHNVLHIDMNENEISY